MEQDTAAAAEDDDFGDLYTDVELEASSAINTTAPLINSVLDVIEDDDKANPSAAAENKKFDAYKTSKRTVRKGSDPIHNRA